MRFFGGGSHRDREHVTYVPLDKIRVNPYQPRRVFDKDKLEELAQSIREVGLIQPITVRKLGGFYEIVAGERRYRAARLAGLEEVPAIVKQFTDQEMARTAIIENVQREDLNPLEEARAYDQLLTEFNLTQEELARQVGKSQSTIANKRRLLKLPEEVQQMLLENVLTERHARALLKLPTPELQVEVGKVVKERGLTVRETIKYIDDLMKTGLEEKGAGSRSTRRFIPKDLRIFVNTINGAIRTMRKAGINAICSESETEEYREFIIRIPKK